MGSNETPKMMKAVQWDSKKRELQINEVPIPEPGENQLLIKIASASLCHSDLMAIGDLYVSVERPKPVTLGHEGAGYIEKLHPSSEGKGFKVGDEVGFLYIIGCCFECDGCQVHNNHCTRGQAQTQGFTFDGFFAEYAIVDWHGAMVLPKGIDVKLASPLFCAGCTCKWKSSTMIVDLD
jgi:propanol-preferring alcohol dehydrogenase